MSTTPPRSSHSQTSSANAPPLPPSIRAVRDATAAGRRGRTLVICLDGTGDKFDGDNSNVVNFVACLKKDSVEQVTYYQSGIGTYDGHGLKGGISAAVDMAVGSGLGIHIKDAYRFLMQNYREGDQICLLGFSRGAYTVRCLAGMLHKVGLLPAHNMAQVNFAYTFYKNSSPEGWAMSAEFKRTFCIDVHVYFVGVWDCVASVGFIPRKLPFGKSATNSIHHFRHAMALDEHRAKFKICQYVHADPAALQRGGAARAAARSVKEKKDESSGRAFRIFSSCFGMKPTPGVNQDDLIRQRNPVSSRGRVQTPGRREDEQSEAKDEDPETTELASSHGLRTDISEVWFAGCHADVGGGAVPNGARHMLSRIPLRWMLRQCFECDTGIRFSTVALARTGLDVSSLWPRYVGPSPRTTREKAAWEKKVRMNMGRYRAVRELEPKMHWTVERRIKEGKKGEEGKDEEENKGKSKGKGKVAEGYRVRNTVDREARWVVTV
ncbi:hypothetical protein BUE80_DR002569 [Diplocarpon rosae]|nr:hypothetical protein BUE80_DR002569 [Diplocarpon rosae]